MSGTPPVYKGAEILLQAARDALAEHVTETIGRFRDEVGDYEDEDMAWTIIWALEERTKNMGDMYGPIETMAEEIERKRRRCASTFTDPEGTERQCVEQAPHPEVVCHDDDWAWGE
jgi:hypothetical protein